MSDFIWIVLSDHVRRMAIPLIVTAALFAVLTSVTAVLVVKSLKGSDGDGSG